MSTKRNETARETLQRWWAKSQMDSECNTVEEYAARVAKRLTTMYGVEVPAGASLETIVEMVKIYDIYSAE